MTCMKLRLIFWSLFTFILISAACGGTKPTAISIGFPTPEPPTPNPAQIQQAQEHWATGVELWEQETFQEAIAEYDQAIQLNPKFTAAYNDRGVAYFYLGQFERAVEDYDAAIGIDGHYAEAYNNRGLAYVRLGQLDRAIERLYPGHPIRRKLRRGFPTPRRCILPKGRF